MKRTINKDLLRWKNSKTRKPLILKGARQTGKTYSLKEFGKLNFNQTHYLNFESNQEIINLFNNTLNPENILDELALILKTTIDTGRDLIIFDEIQECPRALTSLKYFNEEKPELAICCAGSHMGLIFTSESFPVGKVEFLSLFPMSFEEFLIEDGRESLLKKYYEVQQRKEISETFHNELIKIFKTYLVTGGLPEIVATFYTFDKLDAHTFEKIRRLQNHLLNSFISDFTKHAGKINSLHIQSTFNSVCKQIAASQNGNLGKFKFKDVIKGKKGYRDLQGPVEWLKASGLIIQVPIVNRAEVPLYAFTKENYFKLYFFDIGLLGAILDLSLKELLHFDFGIEKGPFTENFVAQELITNGDERLYSWMENTSEIEFLRKIDDELVPIEVKSSKKFRARSLEFYIKRYNPKTAHIISLKVPNFNDTKAIKLPIYCPYIY